MPALDRRLMGLTGGRVALTMGLPTLLLTTTGRKTGEPRSAPLLYMRHGEDLVLIGTSFGSRSHPAWYLNLMAKPQASVLMDRQSFDVIAREASPEERPELWQKATQTYGGYEKYLERVGGREVPIIVLSKNRKIFHIPTNPATHPTYGLAVIASLCLPNPCCNGHNPATRLNKHFFQCP
jgi:deazaflavin-dependent oxidoreductase (nitroreductase family)